MAAGLIYGPQAGCRLKVSHAFDGLRTSEGGSGSSWQHRRKPNKGEQPMGGVQFTEMEPMCDTKRVSLGGKVSALYFRK